MMLTWKAPLNVLCSLLPIVAFASPATVFLRPRTSTTTIEFPPLALTTQMLQCFLFGIYAHRMRMWTLLIPNAVGFALGFVWSTIYPFKVAPRGSDSDSDGDDGGSLLLQWRIQYATSMFLMLCGSLTIRSMPHLSSSIAAIVGVAMCTYPLPSMRRAYAERKPNLMGSGPMNVAMFACCTAWVVHSSPLVEYDVFFLVSNASGVVVQGGALVLRVVIERRRRRRMLAQARAARGDDDSEELSASTPLL